MLLLAKTELHFYITWVDALPVHISFTQPLAGQISIKDANYMDMMFTGT